MSDNEDMFARLASTGIIKLAEAEQRITKLEEENKRLRSLLRKAFAAGEARATASHEAFKQTHPSFEEWIAEQGGGGE